VKFGQRFLVQKTDAVALGCVILFFAFAWDFKKLNVLSASIENLIDGQLHEQNFT
jgi:hypothetical protein